MNSHKLPIPVTQINTYTRDFLAFYFHSKMVRYAQLVVGPAGIGKSTYCDNMSKHFEDMKRTVKVVNLDPAAEYFKYPVSVDVRDLIQLEDAMEDDTLHFGPNGGLVFCMEYLAKNLDWLVEQLGDDEDDDYVIFDCPGQIELYTHLPIMKQIVCRLENSNFRVCGVFLLDSQFLLDRAKFFSGILAALSVMVTLEIAHINVMTKVDLLSKVEKQELEKYLEPDCDLTETETMVDSFRHRKQFHRLNQAIARIIQDYSLVKFIPLDISEEESLADLALIIDNVLQYGEDFDVKEPRESRDETEEADFDRNSHDNEKN